MSTLEERESTQHHARVLLEEPIWRAGDEREQDARSVSCKLMRFREFPLLARLIDRLIRTRPDDSWLRKLQTQSLIETGQMTAAIDVARACLSKLSSDSVEWSELHGLLGRAFKQIAVDVANSSTDDLLRALRESAKAYAIPYLRNRTSWHAINLVATISYIKRLDPGARVDFDPATLAQEVIDTQGRNPNADRWTAVTLAEAHLAREEFDEAERWLKAFLLDENVQAFEVGSALRQFSELWGFSKSPQPRVRTMIECMRIRLLQLEGGQLRVDPGHVMQQRQRGTPKELRLQAILGEDGPRSYKWWQTGLERARSVAAIYAGGDQRIGTGFVVDAAPFGLGGTGERLLLTNYHVLNSTGAGGALRPEDAHVVFEAISTTRRFSIDAILWESPVDRHDACVVRLKDPLDKKIKALSIAPRLPVVEDSARVYVIGHASGGGLQFSFQDNQLLDHEGPGAGNPPIAGVQRLHYRAPTEKGSSGSPVFNSANWDTIGLHHAGGLMAKLNGKPGSWSANEGIALSCIALAASRSQ